jgi:hypothetical protein
VSRALEDFVRRIQARQILDLAPPPRSQVILIDTSV